MTMKYLLPHQKVTLLKATLNLCDLLTQIKKPCPVNPGHHVFRYHDRLHNLPKVNIMNCRSSYRRREYNIVMMLSIIPLW